MCWGCPAAHPWGTSPPSCCRMLLLQHTQQQVLGWQQAAEVRDGVCYRV
jgi:hypothetical protein